MKASIATTISGIPTTRLLYSSMNSAAETIINAKDCMAAMIRKISIGMPFLGLRLFSSVNLIADILSLLVDIIMIPN